MHFLYAIDDPSREFNILFTNMCSVTQLHGEYEKLLAMLRPLKENLC